MLCSELLVHLESPSVSSSLPTPLLEVDSPDIVCPLSLLSSLSSFYSLYFLVLLTKENQVEGIEEEDLKCRVIKRGYHLFLQETARFIQVIQDSELRWRWDHESLVFEGAGWLQGLWASRKTVCIAPFPFLISPFYSLLVFF